MMAATLIRAALVLATLSFGWGCGGKATDTGTDTDTDSTGSGDDGYATTLVINEFMASNGGSYTNDLAGSPDWIELYNPTAEEISLEGYTITDDLEDPTKHALANGLVIEADGYLLLFAASDDTLGDQHRVFESQDSGRNK